MIIEYKKGGFYGNSLTKEYLSSDKMKLQKRSHLSTSEYSQGSYPFWTFHTLGICDCFFLVIPMITNPL